MGVGYVYGRFSGGVLTMEFFEIQSVDKGLMGVKLGLVSDHGGIRVSKGLHGPSWSHIVGSHIFSCLWENISTMMSPTFELHHKISLLI